MFWLWCFGVVCFRLIAWVVIGFWCLFWLIWVGGWFGFLVRLVFDLFCLVIVNLRFLVLSCCLRCARALM